MRRFVALELGADFREKNEEGSRLECGRARRSTAQESRNQNRINFNAEIERREEERINFREREDEVGR
jgi:hypothetical protein